MARTYFRLHDLDRCSPSDLLRPEHQISRVWCGEIPRKCQECGGHGYHYDADGDEVSCEACGGEGEHLISEQIGVSVCRSLSELRDYMHGRSAYTEGCVIVELEGTEASDVDVDASEGAVLVHPTRIVEILPVDDHLDNPDRPKTRNMSSRAVRKKLRDAGCEEVRQKGSHVQVKCPGGRQTTVPLHGARDIKKGTLRSMERSLQLDIDGDGRPKPNPRRNAMPLTVAQRRKIEAAELISQTAYWKDVETAALDILRLSDSPKEVAQYVRDSARSMTMAHAMSDPGHGFTRSLDILQWSGHPDAAWIDRKANKIKFEYEPAKGAPLRSSKPLPKDATAMVKLIAYYAYWADLFTMIESKRAEGLLWRLPSKKKAAKKKAAKNPTKKATQKSNRKKN